MRTEFISDNLWRKLTEAARNSRQPCLAAVAYFGAGASRLLPLRKGSQLVVDASERSVASGQTCPADLIELMNRGVSIYSVENLHAKVFVLGRSAYIGSSNVSSRSAEHLVEAAIHTSEPQAVAAARKFVKDHCLHELTPTVLHRLAKLYRAPKFAGTKRRNGSKPPTIKPSIPPVFLAQLHLYHWSELEESLHKKELPEARKQRNHSKGYLLNSFIHTGKCPYHRDQVVVQVTDEGGKGVFMSPPGNVVHVRTIRNAKTSTSVVYIEVPASRRRRVKEMARELGYKRQNLFYRKGRIQNSSFAQALLRSWGARP